MTTKHKQRWLAANLAPVCFVLVAVVVTVFIRADYGISWDEAAQAAFAEKVRQYFMAGFDYSKVADFSVVNVRFYSPGLDLLAATLANVTGSDIFTCRHTVTGLFWVATFWPVCRLGRRMAGGRGGWYAGMALFGMPVYLGHAFINPKDLPLACAITWLLDACVSMSLTRKPGWKHALGLGLVFGLVLAIRSGAWFCGVLLGLPLLTRLWRARRLGARVAARNQEAPPRGPTAFCAAWMRLTAVAVAALPLAWLVMVAPWPYAHQGPLSHPLESMFYASHFSEVYQVLFQGKGWPSNALPWSYYFVYLGLTTPVGILLLSLPGHLFGIRRVLSRGFGFPVVAGVLFFIWFPLSYFLIARPNVYDGPRHLLFILPFVAVLAGAGAAGCARWLSLRFGLWGRAIPALFLLASVPSLFSMHPYQYAYFNFLAGDRATIHARYETDYWVTAYREAAGWLNSLPSAPNHPLHVLVMANGRSLPTLSQFTRPDITLDADDGAVPTTALPPSFDYSVASVRYGWWRNFPDTPVVHTIERDGILLCIMRGQGAR